MSGEKPCGSVKSSFANATRRTSLSLIRSTAQRNYSIILALGKPPGYPGTSVKVLWVFLCVKIEQGGHLLKTGKFVAGTAE